MTNISLPSIKKSKQVLRTTLPFNGYAVSEKGFSFFFACFDRTHRLFNLGDNTEDGVVSNRWFVELLDCFKNINNMTIPEVKGSMHDLHPVDWSKTNANLPDNSDQFEYWQFRLNKSRGRVIGPLINGVFYVVWLDPHHNLTDSEGYGGITLRKAAYSVYEWQEQQINLLNDKIKGLEDDLAITNELLQLK